MNITIREPGSALTHFIAMLLALCAAVPLLVRAAVHSGVKSLTAMTVFMISMVLLYAAEFLSKASGSPVQNGFPLFCISQWAGAACPFWDSCFPCFRFTPFYGCSPAD